VGDRFEVVGGLVKKSRDRGRLPERDSHEKQGEIIARGVAR
jgi:hypothetical protein